MAGFTEIGLFPQILTGASHSAPIALYGLLAPRHLCVIEKCRVKEAQLARKLIYFGEIWSRNLA